MKLIDIFLGELPKGEGWIRWGGGECPVGRETLVEVEYRNRQIYHVRGVRVAGRWDWQHHNDPGDIIAYRIRSHQQSTGRDKMKLIDILRQELPKRGGWPEGVARLAQDPDGDLQKLSNNEAYFISGLGWAGRGRDDFSGDYHLRKMRMIADDCDTTIVTRGEYEASGWDGKGLPPVGCECEGKQFAQINWTKFTVVAIAKDHVFGFWNDNVAVGLSPKMWEFRPIPTEAERAIDEMVRLSGVSTGAAKILYDAGYRK